MSQVQDLLTPIPSAYHTDERAAIQEIARQFAMERILPVANELDPVQGEIPDDIRKEMGELGFFGILARCVRILPRHRRARPRLDEHRQHHRPRQHGIEE